MASTTCKKKKQNGKKSNAYPAGQVVVEARPANGQNAPLGHIVQSDGADFDCAELYVPALQFTDALEASGQYAPVGQSMHESAEV